MNKLALGLVLTMGVSAVVNAAGDAAAGQERAGLCFGCHGADGNSMVPNFPKLAGQHANYTNKQILDIYKEERKVPEMAAVWGDLTEEDFVNISAYFASQAIKPGTTDPSLAELGERVYTAGNLETGVAACNACHGANGEGNKEAGFPVLAGQHAAYLENQLKKFADGARNNDPAGMMRGVADKMSAQEMKAVASYLQGLK